MSTSVLLELAVANARVVLPETVLRLSVTAAHEPMVCAEELAESSYGASFAEAAEQENITVWVIAFGTALPEWFEGSLAFDPEALRHVTQLGPMDLDLLALLTPPGQGQHDRLARRVAIGTHQNLVIDLLRGVLSIPSDCQIDLRADAGHMTPVAKAFRNR
jgi:hypothetical protein